MDEKVLQRLDYDKVKQNVMEYAASYLGKQHVERMQPMDQWQRVRQALNETAEAKAMLEQGASVPIPSLEGIDKVLSLLDTGYVYTEHDFANIQQFLYSCIQLKKYMAAKSSIAPTVSSLASSMHELAKLKTEIERCVHGGRVRDEASKDLSRIRKKAAVVEGKIKDKIESLMSRYRNIMQENLVSLRNGRYVLPIKKEHRKLIKGSVLDESSSGQTVYVEPQDVAHLQFDLNEMRVEESREEAKVLSYLTTLVEEGEPELRMNVETVGVYDYLFAKAKYAVAIGGRNVEINGEGRIHIRGAVHPLLGRNTVPLHFSIGDKYKSLIITGPNTGGKTVALKTVGLLTLMVQSGLLVPAEQGSVFAVFRNIAADIGDGQSIEQSLSTFSSHIRNVIDMLSYADGSTLILIDEMASGTDPGEGIGLSIAVLEELHRRGATVIVTTHYNEIKNFAAVTPGFENARMEFDEETLQPLYRLKIGEAGRSYAFLIALKLGISPDIIRRSQQITEASRREYGGAAPAATEAVERAGIDLPPQQATIEPADTGSPPRQTAVEPADIDSPPQQTAVEPPSPVRPAPAPAVHAAADPEEGEAPARKRLKVGDNVYISYLQRNGIVYEAEDARGNVGVLIQQQKFKINHKRLSLYIDGKELYPEDYDLDIVFETKENRKKKKLMDRKHVEGCEIVTDSEN